MTMLDFQNNQKPPVLCLMGPTASGKTDLALALAQHLPLDIISVDSTLVYRFMDIGTAKPDLEQRAQAPHYLVDIRDPTEIYSSAEFCADVLRLVENSMQNQRVPLLVGGTMMYFKALFEGMADMPSSDPVIRAQLAQEAEQEGWPTLHQQLQSIDPEYAAVLHPNHSQRISRALEVYRISGRTMTQWHQEQSPSLWSQCYRALSIALAPERDQLNQRIEQRFFTMLSDGFVDEVSALKARGDLHLDLPSMRAVGYRQVWQYLDDEYDYEEMTYKGIVATRQLAKRQLTWLRSWKNLHYLPSSTQSLQKSCNWLLNFWRKESIK